MEKLLLMKINAVCGDALSVSGGEKNVGMIPFTAIADSELYIGSGEGTDTQFTENGRTQLSARYMLEGRDICGENCRIFVENNGVADNGYTSPVIVTDSRILGRLNNTRILGRIEPAENGVCVSFFEQVGGYERTEHFFMAEDGRHIYYELFIPESENGRFPLVIAAHGFNSCSADMREQLGYIASRGIAVCAFDFCGGGNSTKSDGSTTEMSIRTEQNDLREVFTHITALPEIDTERVFLFGESQGGLVSALTAAELNGRVRELFLIYPAFCIPHDWLGRLEELPDDEPIEFAGVTLSRKYAEEVPDYDIFARTAKFDGHITIFHGDSDPVVDPEYSRQLVSACRDADLFICPGQQHWLNSGLKKAAAGYIADRINAYSKE